MESSTSSDTGDALQEMPTENHDDLHQNERSSSSKKTTKGKRNTPPNNIVSMAKER
jgi:hypothetical protein